MRLVVLKDGIYISRDIERRHSAEIVEMFGKAPDAMVEVCRKIKDIGEVDEGTEIESFTKQPHDSEVSDFLYLQMAGIIENLRLDNGFGSKEEQKSNDFYLYEVDKTFALIVRNCVDFDYKAATCAIVTPLKYPELEVANSSKWIR